MQKKLAKKYWDLTLGQWLLVLFGVVVTLTADKKTASLPGTPAEWNTYLQVCVAVLTIRALTYAFDWIGGITLSKEALDKFLSYKPSLIKFPYTAVLYYTGLVLVVVLGGDFYIDMLGTPAISEWTFEYPVPTWFSPPTAVSILWAFLLTDIFWRMWWAVVSVFEDEEEEDEEDEEPEPDGTMLYPSLHFNPDK